MTPSGGSARGQAVENRDRWPLLAALTLLAAATLWTYRRVLFQQPWGRDAEDWIQKADPSHPGWAKWVFGSGHFVGWRPVTAFSFTLNGWFGTSPAAFHGVDFAALAATVVLVGLVGWEMFRSDRDDVGAAIAAYAAAAFVAAHPVLEDVVPLVARRSYELATAFASAGLLVWLPEIRREPRLLSGRIALATVLLCLGYASNEAVFPIAVLLPFLAWNQDPPAKLRAALAAVRPAILPTLGASALILLRNLLVSEEHSWGYIRKFLSYTSGGENHIRMLEGFEPGTIALAAGSYVLFPCSEIGDESLFWGEHSGWWAAVAVAVVGWIAWEGVVVAVAQRRDPVARRPLVLLLWAAITVGLYVVGNTWFWRQGYPLAIPVGLALAACARSALARGSRVERWATVGVGAALALSIARYSPMIGGFDDRGATEEVKATQILDSLDAALAKLPYEAWVWLVVPGDAILARDVEKAALRMKPRETQRVRLLGWVPDARPGRPAIRILGADAGPPFVQLGESGVWEPSARETTGRDLLIPAARILPRKPLPTWLWWWDGPEQSTLEQLEIRAPVEPSPEPR